MSLLESFENLDKQSKQVIYEKEIKPISSWLLEHGCYYIPNAPDIIQRYYILDYKVHEYEVIKDSPGCSSDYKVISVVEHAEYCPGDDIFRPAIDLHRRDQYICKQVEFFRNAFSLVDIVIDDNGEIWVEPIHPNFPILLKNVHSPLPGFKFRLPENHYNFLLLTDCSPGIIEDGNIGNIAVMYDNSIKLDW
jgi:hypothetical protein